MSAARAMGKLGIGMAMAIVRGVTQGEREERLFYKHGTRIVPALTSAEPRRGGCACNLGENRKNAIPTARRHRPLVAAKAKSSVITISLITILSTIFATPPPITITNKRGSDTDRLDCTIGEKEAAQALGESAPGKTGETVPTTRP